MKSLPVPERFAPAYIAIKGLAADTRYLAAFIFGSVARGDWTQFSDFDVKVLTDQDNDCANINHPVIGGVKLDITFHSQAQNERFTRAEIEKGQRIPMLAESIIVFDKTGALGRLKAEAGEAQPKPLPIERYPWLQFMVYHANDKIERGLDADAVSALLTMHTSLNDLLHYHYQLRAHWIVSSKRLLSDLDRWDPDMARLVRAFVMTNDPQAKFSLWSEMVTQVLAPVGGRKAIAEINCICETCRHDLERLIAP